MANETKSTHTSEDTEGTTRTPNPGASTHDDPHSKGDKTKKGKGKGRKDRRHSSRGAGDGGTQGKKPKQDPFFYAMNEEAIKNMANFPWLETVGDTFFAKDSVPGIMVLDYLPIAGCKTEDYATIASSKPKGDTKTRAAKAFFDYLVQGFTGGSPDFEAPDTIMVALAGNSLMAAMIEGKRAYGFLKYFLQFNEYYAEEIVTALGFDYDDLVSNAASFRTEYNIRVAQINKLIAVPYGFTIGDRWDFISSYLFLDSPDAEYSTMLAWNSVGALKFNATKLKTGSCLEWLKKPTSTVNGRLELFTVDTFFRYIDELIDALDDSDIRTIFGSIRRVYSDQQLKKMSEIDDSYLSKVMDHDIVRMQFHNAAWTDQVFGNAPAAENVLGWAPTELFSADIPTPPGIKDYNIAMYQNENGRIVSTIYGRSATSVAAGGIMNLNDSEFLLDLYKHEVSPGNVLDATANAQICDTSLPAPEISVLPNTVELYAVNARTEILVQCRVRLMEVELICPKYITGTATGEVNIRARASGNAGTLASEITHVNSHPLIHAIYNKATVSVIGELDKYTMISKTKVSKLHDKCMYQLLSLPANSKSVTK